MNVEPLLESFAVPLVVTPEGGLRVAGTRVSLDSVLFEFERGASAEDIASSFPSLALADVYAVLDCYLGRRAQFDEYLAARRVRIDEIRETRLASSDQADVRERLLARRTAAKSLAVFGAELVSEARMNSKVS